jgi:hypothetical protein
MSDAIAAVGPTECKTATQTVAPVVFFDGVPYPDLHAVSATLRTPLDDRRATLSHQADHAIDFVDGEITIAVPHRLSDDEVCWQVLLSGRATQAERDQSARRDTYQRTVRDRLSAVLDEPVQLLGPLEAGGLDLAAALHRLGALIDAGLVFACGEDLISAPVSISITTPQTIRAWLGAVLSERSLMIEQTLELQSRQVRRTLAVVPERAGRRVALPWPGVEGRGGSVQSVSVDRQSKPPRRWVARGQRAVVEDTFVLQPGWDPSLQSQPDSDYGRLTSSNFSRFGSVYRAWVLNEDGAYDGPRFDAGSLFDQPSSIDQPLRFGLCLTQDTAGRRLTPIIESSTDSGATWSTYPGQAEVMNERAGVALIDDTLPAAILAAAKAGTLRLRITASLTSPVAIEATRWDGNPFAGPAPTRIVDFANNFAWRTVAPTSIHRAAIDTGLLSADTADDRQAMRQRLQEHIAQQPGPDLVATIELHGAWTALRPGDRVSDALGRGTAIDGNPSSFGTRDARIQRIDLAFGVSNNTPRTRLRLD